MLLLKVQYGAGGKTFLLRFHFLPCKVLYFIFIFREEGLDSIRTKRPGHRSYFQRFVRSLLLIVENDSEGSGRHLFS